MISIFFWVLITILLYALRFPIWKLEAQLLMSSQIMPLNRIFNTS